MTLISIIMPAYNCASFIHDAMFSVLRQSVDDLELIVVNDGSTDNTLEIIQSIANGDSRVKVLSQKNSGKPSIVRNRGLQLAKGEYIGFLDGDDFYCEGKLEESLKVLKLYPEIELIFHDVNLININGDKQSDTYLEAVGFADSVLCKSDKLSDDTYYCDSKELFFHMCIRVTTILMNSLLIKKDRLFLEKVFFPEELTIGEDVDLWFRLVKNGSIAFINKPLSCYRIYSQSITHKPGRNLYDPVLTHIRNYKRRADFLESWQRKSYRRRIASDLYNAGYNFNLRGQGREAILLSCRSLLWSFKKEPIKEIFKAMGSFVSFKSQANV